MTRPTVAFYTDAPGLGGAEIVLGTLLAALRPGLELAIIGTDAAVVEHLHRCRPGAPAYLLRAPSGWRDGRAFTAHARLLASLRPRIFQANLGGPAACQYALAIAELLPGMRTIAVEHLPDEMRSRRQAILKRATSRGLDAHIAVGAGAAREIESLTGIPRGSLRVIYNGVPDVASAPVQPDAPAQRDAPVRREFDGWTVGSLGRLHRQKGYDVLLRAIARLPDARAVIVGEGPERLALQQLAASLGVAERIRLLGHSPRARDYLSTFDVFVLPSRFEALPLSIIEAMLASRPVVATRVGSVAELVLDGETGLLVDPEDERALTAALRRLLDEPELAAAMGRRGRELALRFSPAAMARSYESLYSELLPD